MRAMLWLAVLAFLGWSGWWWVASGAARTGVDQGLAGLQAQGWQAGHDGLTVSGYPNRIDMTATAPRLATPDGQWGWSSAFVQVFALSYKPWHLIAALAPEQQIRTPAGPLRLSANRLRSSLVLVPGADLTLDRFQLTGEDLALDGVLRLGARSLSLATRPAAGIALAHDIGLDLRDIALDPVLMAALPPGRVPDRIALLRLDAVAGFAHPWNRHTAAAPPPLTSVTLRELRAEWGPVKLHLSGDLHPDEDGLAEGQLSLRLEGAEVALDLAVALGLMVPETRQTWATVLRGMTAQDGALQLPLRVSGGVVALGRLPLAPAPRLVW